MDPHLRRVTEVAAQLDVSVHRLRAAMLRWEKPFPVYRRWDLDRIPWLKVDEVRVVAEAERWPRAAEDSMIPKALARRFTVLERDGFACRYCGRRPPEVALEVDHVLPKSRGGTDDPENLAACCRDCNSGKRNRLLA